MPRASCVGLDGKDCVFKYTQPGVPALSRKGSDQCIWCDLNALQRLLASKGAKQSFVPMLKAFKAYDEEAYDVVIERIGEVSPDASFYDWLASKEPEDPIYACPGIDHGTPCIFNKKKPGRRAELYVGQTRCVFCMEDELRNLMSSSDGMNIISEYVRVFLEHDEQVYNVAIDRIAKLPCSTFLSALHWRRAQITKQ